MPVPSGVASKATSWRSATSSDEVETLDGLLERLQSEATSLETLASIGVTGDLPPDSVIIDLVYDGLLDVTVFEPSLTAVADLQSSGLVPLIDDVELRLGLSGLRQSVGMAGSNAVVNRAGPQQQIFDPFVLRQLPFVWRSLPAIQPVAPMRSGPFEWDPLFDDQGQAMVAMRYDFVLATAEDWEALKEEIERLCGEPSSQDSIVDYLRHRREVDSEGPTSDAIQAALEHFWLDRARSAPESSALDEHLRREEEYLSRLGRS